MSNDPTDEASSTADVEKSKDNQAPPKGEKEGEQYPTGLALASILGSVTLAMFLVSLVNPGSSVRLLHKDS